jgi:hypothetical protein
MANYFIAIGGTGARCLEAVVYLAAAGLLNNNLHVLIIDPDANNGNSSAVDGLMIHYYLLHRQQQPDNPQFKRYTPFNHNAPAPVLLQAAINNDGQYPARWNDQHEGRDRHFRDIVEYTTRPDKLRNFIDLFYHADDMKMELEVGYQGRTNVGAVALKQDLEETSEVNQSGLREFLTALTEDLQNGETRVFVSGSVFGGTGAAGIPTLPALIKGLDDRALPAPARANLRWGCALMAPYFIFPRNSSTRENLGPGTDSTRHPVATQAALLHYAHTPPGYQHVYLLGAPNRGQTNTQNHPGGDEQRNLPHYAELAAALAALDFYSPKRKIDREERKLHYADSYDNSGRDLGVSWETIPVYRDDYQRERNEIKKKLVSFTTFAYLYRNVLHNEFIRNRRYLDSAMYKDNFTNLSLEADAEEQALRALNDLCENYLEWLKGVGRTGGNMIPALFNWEALETTDIKACEQRVGNLMEMGNQANRPPRYSTSGYQKIMEKLTRTRLVSPNTQSATGLFIYLLYQAVYEFCKENYDWR